MMRIDVIGGGMMGLSCAWRLAQAGGRVRVLEARRCGEGATLAALGALWPPGRQSAGAHYEMHRASLGMFEGFVREIEVAAGVRVRYRRGGRVELFGSAEAAGSGRAEAADDGTVRVMGREELAAMGVVGEFGGVWHAGTAQVRVGELVEGLKAACGRAGVVIEEGKNVDIEMCLVEADRVLVTAGAWAGGMPEVREVAEVRPVRGQGVALRPPAGFGLRCIVKAGAVYVVPWEEEVLVGSTTEAGAGFDEGVTGEALAMLVAGAGAMVPGLRGAEVLRQWSGLRPQVRRKPHLPLMGRHPRLGRVYLCVGHYKTGIGMSAGVSGVMREIVMGGAEGNAEGGM